MRPGCGLVFGVWGVDRRPDPTAKLTDPNALFQSKGNGGALAQVRTQTLPRRKKKKKRERERVAILAQAMSGSSPWGGLCEPFLLLVFSTPTGQPTLAFLSASLPFFRRIAEGGGQYLCALHLGGPLRRPRCLRGCSVTAAVLSFREFLTRYLKDFGETLRGLPARLVPGVFLRWARECVYFEIVTVARPTT